MLSDSAMLHVTLAHIAMGSCNLPNIELGPDVIYYIGQAIAIVNKRISNFYYEPIMHKDKTIMTITILTHFDVRTLSAPILLVIIANTTMLLDQIWFRG